MTLADELIIIVACAVFILIVVWVFSVWRMLRKLKKKVLNSYRELRTEVKRLYLFADNVSDRFDDKSKERVAAIRNEAEKMKGAEAKAECDAVLQSRLKNALLNVENAEELKTEYADIEMDIANMRKKYNAAVREYNCQIKIFPDRIVSAVFRLKPYEFYTADEVSDD